MDQFAEHLANGLSVADAAKAMGLDGGYAHSLLQRIRKRLGPQAK